MVIVDDSIVRGTTSKQLVKLVREAGPKEIHFRVTSPPIKHPCYYGMDFPSENELIANRYNGNIEEIRKELGVDSLSYLSLDKLLEGAKMENETGPPDPDAAVRHAEKRHKSGRAGFCTACFSGEYPVAIESSTSKDAHEV